MDAELRRQLAWGRDALAARAAMRDVLLALRPGLPFAVLGEGVAAVIPDTEGLTAAPARYKGASSPRLRGAVTPLTP